MYKNIINKISLISASCHSSIFISLTCTKITKIKPEIKKYKKLYKHV